MITSITFKNFKCFKKQQLGLAALNVFAGLNGAGKSSAIQSMLLLRQSWESGLLQSGKLQLNGSMAELGTLGEVYCAEPDDDDIIALHFGSESFGAPYVIESKYSPESFEHLYLDVDGDWRSSNSAFELFCDGFNYLKAERVGPRKIFHIPPPGKGDNCDVGREGEYAPFVYSERGRQLQVKNRDILLESSDKKIYETLHYQCPLWMQRLFPGYSVESEMITKADQLVLSLALQRKSTGQSHFVRPTNTGFGLSYALGIVVAGLVSNAGSVLLVENPEAHLHPRAQSIMGEFLARVSAGGTQVFVETHSEHVLNGMRRMVKQGIVQHNNVKVHFFSNFQTGFYPEVTEIHLTEQADMSSWPKGFFDQLDDDLSYLFE